MSWFEDASRRKKWLVGVSGGADSVALLHLLVEKGFSRLVVCHLDHRLRGRASTEDARFVERLAKELGLEFEIGKAEVKRLAKEAGESIETAGRKARHAFFGSCAKKHRCSRVVLAHHADDQAETVLWNLLRGSHGLKGMKEVQRVEGVELHRPLLSWRRSELRAWLENKCLKWREDATNGEPVAVRNRLRNEVFPLLAEISGRDPVAAFVRGAADWEERQSVLDWAVKKANIIDPQERLHLKALRSLPVSLQRVAVADYLAKRGTVPGREVLHRVMEAIDPTGPPAVNLPGGKRFRRREGRGFVE